MSVVLKNNESRATDGMCSKTARGNAPRWHVINVGRR